MMRLPQISRAAFRVAVLAGLLGTPLVLVSAPASAQEDNFTEQIFSTLGLVPAAAPEIDYRERAPLVVPPSGDILPPPRTEGASANPAWPKDVDVEARKKEASAARRPVSFSDRQASRALTPAEVARGTNANARNDGPPMMRNNASRPDWLSSVELGFPGWGNRQAAPPMAFQGEPERTSLTQPPPGYMTPAQGHAYGVVEDRPEDKGWSLPNLFDRTQKNNDRH